MYWHTYFAVTQTIFLALSGAFHPNYVEPYFVIFMSHATPEYCHWTGWGCLLKVTVSLLLVSFWAFPRVLNFFIPRATVVVASQLSHRGRKWRHMVTESTGADWYVGGTIVQLFCSALWLYERLLTCLYHNLAAKGQLGTTADEVLCTDNKVLSGRTSLVSLFKKEL